MISNRVLSHLKAIKEPEQPAYHDETKYLQEALPMAVTTLQLAFYPNQLCQHLANTIDCCSIDSPEGLDDDGLRECVDFIHTE